MYALCLCNDNNYNGVIYKTTDTGLTWTIYDTYLPNCFGRIEFINDCIALIAGTNGTLIKWNKNIVVTEVVNTEKNDPQLDIFPNPAKDVLYIKTNSKVRRELYSLIGQLIFTTNQNEIDVSSYGKGIYYLKVGNTTKKIVIE